jgi:hypothetical protein
VAVENAQVVDFIKAQKALKSPNLAKLERNWNVRN